MIADSPFADLQCGSCGAQIRIDAGLRTARCPFCDAPSVVDRPPTADRPTPLFVLGFAVERDAATRAVGDWIRSRKMAPFGLRNLAVERLNAVYLPAYLYSATASSRYEASIAEKYKKLALDRDSDGGTSLRRREETEYRELTGRRVASLADILVTASHNVSNEEVQAIEPFDLSRLRRYTPALLQGWSAEEVSSNPDTCLEHARGEAHASVTRLLHEFMPGDGVRSLQHHTEFEDESIDLTLVPVWICTMRYDPRKPPLRILVNGQTAKAAGWVPFSWAKLGLILASVIAVVVAVAGFGLLRKAFL
jgi:hypothetical protein